MCNVLFYNLKISKLHKCSSGRWLSDLGSLDKTAYLK